MPRGKLPLILLLTPCTLLITLFVVAPLSYIAVVSFFEYSNTELWISHFTLENYTRFLFDPFYLKLVWTTIKIGLITNLICAVLGYPLAYFLAKGAQKKVEIYIFLLISPLMISTVIRIFGLIVLLGRQGLINQFLTLTPFIEFPVNFIPSQAGVVVGLANLLLPYMVLPLMSSIESIPNVVEEAAISLGAGRIGVFFKVILPLSLPGLVSGSVLVYLIAISALVTPALMGLPAVRMLGNQVYDEVLVSYNWPFAASISIVMILLTFVVLFFYLQWSRKHLSGGAKS